VSTLPATSQYLFDRRSESGDNPGTHALVVGVSAYTHLPPHDSKEPDQRFGLRGVASAALSAYRMAQWLIERKDHLASPLLTVRLMVTPSDREKEVAPELGALAGPCGVNDFLRAANEWRLLARRDRHSMAFFYFCGLGKELARSEPILLMEDFGDELGPILRGAVSVNNIVYGLSPTERQPEIARTQLFFIDSSRTSLEEAPSRELSNPTSVFDAQFLGVDDRCAPVFYSSQPGGQAFSVKGQQTLFSSALLECLNGAAAVPAPSHPGDETETDSDQMAWQVTISSLIDELDEVLRQRRREKAAEYEKYGVKQEYTVGGVVRDAVIHKLDKPPDVPVSFQFETFGSPVEIRDECDQVVTKFTPEENGPNLQITLPAGFYRAVILNADSEVLAHRPRRTKLVMPPQFEWKVRA
jgi:hypothetical protein